MVLWRITTTQPFFSTHHYPPCWCGSDEIGFKGRYGTYPNFQTVRQLCNCGSSNIDFNLMLKYQNGKVCVWLKSYFPIKRPFSMCGGALNQSLFRPALIVMRFVRGNAWPRSNKRRERSCPGSECFPHFHDFCYLPLKP